MESLAPPPTDPLVRSEPPFVWGVTPSEADRGHQQADAVIADTLDPDVALWRAVVVSVWPFTGAPTHGEFPTGWLGVDAAGTVYSCIAGGAPGTWAVVGAAAAVAALTAASVEVGQTGGDIGFYGVTPVARPSAAGVTTVAELLTLLESTGLIST